MAAIVLATHQLAAVVRLVLQHCGIETRAVSTAGEARGLLSAPTTLVVLDMSMPGAADLLAESALAKLPTLALIDLEGGASSFSSFANGADQVVRVPFTPDELAVRAAALLRRLGHEVRLVHDQDVDSLVLSIDEHVTMAGERVQLSPQQNSLLYLLAATAGSMVAFDAVRRFVWGVERGASDDTVRELVTSLVRAVGDRPGQHFTVQRRQNALLLGSRPGQ